MKKQDSITSNGGHLKHLFGAYPFDTIKITVSFIHFSIIKYTDYCFNAYTSGTQQQNPKNWKEWKDKNKTFYFLGHTKKPWYMNMKLLECN